KHKMHRSGPASRCCASFSPVFPESSSRSIKRQKGGPVGHGRLGRGLGMASSSLSLFACCSTCEDDRVGGRHVPPNRGVTSAGARGGGVLMPGRRPLLASELYEPANLRLHLSD